MFIKYQMKIKWKNINEIAVNEENYSQLCIHEKISFKS